jgi:hypothetical protein
VNTKPDYRDMSLNHVTQGTYHGGKLEKGDYDHGHRGMKLGEFVSHKHSRLSELSEANVLGVRIYTTSSYANLNNPLRKQRLPHPFKKSVYHLDEGLRKLRTVAANKKETFCKIQHLYRGMNGRKMKTEELKESGGIEMALMSTSNKRETAVSYAKADEVCMYAYVHVYSNVCVCVCVLVRVCVCVKSEVAQSFAQWHMPLTYTYRNHATASRGGAGLIPSKCVCMCV